MVLARRAKRYGMQNSLRIVLEARRADIPLSLAFAMVEQESGNGANIWGGDPRPNGATTGLNNARVTKARYLLYRQSRGSHGQGGMQGVGPMQLTWWEFQDLADRLGGCHIPKYNLRVGFSHLKVLIAANGRRAGVKAYNGAGPDADNYTAHVNDVLARKWHARLRG
jgi:soluble lytic murein transglycosylase-like protein